MNFDEVKKRNLVEKTNIKKWTAQKVERNNIREFSPGPRSEIKIFFYLDSEWISWIHITESMYTYLPNLIPKRLLIVLTKGLLL